LSLHAARATAPMANPALTILFTCTVLFEVWSKDTRLKQNPHTRARKLDRIQFFL
jgi:hypothetical protein